MDEFLADVVAIERQMIGGLIAAGCRYIQIDAPGYTAYVDKVSLERMRARGEDPEENMRARSPPTTPSSPASTASPSASMCAMAIRGPSIRRPAR